MIDLGILRLRGEGGDPYDVDHERAGRDLVDREAQRVLGVSVEEFLSRYDAGELNLEDEDILAMVMLIPFG